MNFSAGLLPLPIYWMAAVIHLAILGFAVWSAPWKSFRADPQRIHVLLGSCVALMLLWQMHAGLRPGLGYHILGGTLFVLMFGWQLAFIGLSLVALGSTLNGMGDFVSLPLNTLVMSGVPVGLSYAAYRLAVRFLPHNFFVYVLGNGFFCGALAMAATVGVSAVLLLGFSPYSAYRVTHEYLYLSPLMMFAEAFFTGMLATGLVLFRPEWVSTFDDRRYLSGK
jgi:uncharacterized membrane protein